MDLSGKKIAVYGLGVSGQAVWRYLSTKKLGHLLLVNQGDPAAWPDPDIVCDCPVTKLEDKEGHEQLASCDVIILSPGIPRSVEPLAKALEGKVPVWNEVELAYRYFAGKIIAVTGTNGKTSTVSFLGQLFQNAGQRVFVGGNIGTPFIEAIGRQELGQYFDLAVLELSSFQCESLEHFSASHNMILNLAPNHSERYDSVEDYRQAKWLMVKNACKRDQVFIGEGVGEANYPVQAVVRPLSRAWDQEFKELFPWRDLKVVGPHNRYNLFFAWQVAQACSISKDLFTSTLLSFEGVPHRVEKLTHDQKIFNDAKSTNWQATRTAVTAVAEGREKEEAITLIVGGQKRSDEDLPARDTISFLFEHCHQVYAIGDVGPDLAALDQRFQVRTDLEQVIKELSDQDDPTILFSPAYPSFDQYKNYEERGEHFKTLVGEYL